MLDDQGFTIHRGAYLQLECAIIHETDAAYCEAKADALLEAGDLRRAELAYTSAAFHRRQLEHLLASAARLELQVPELDRQEALARQRYWEYCAPERERQRLRVRRKPQMPTNPDDLPF